jgi:hypothetical protein
MVVKGSKTSTKDDAHKLISSLSYKKRIDYNNVINGSKLMSQSNGVYIKQVGIEDVGIEMLYKPNKTTTSFLGSILGHIEGNINRMKTCKVILFTMLKDAETDMPLQVTNKNGNKYPVDILVFATGGSSSLANAVTELGNVCTEIAKTECSLGWRYGTPTFMYKGDISPPEVMPLGHYLITTDCVSVMKKIYEDISTKATFLEREDRDLILKEVFGDSKIGLECIEGVPAEIFDVL